MGVMNVSGVFKTVATLFTKRTYVNKTNNPNCTQVFPKTDRKRFFNAPMSPVKQNRMDDKTMVNRYVCVDCFRSTKHPKNVHCGVEAVSLQTWSLNDPEMQPRQSQAVVLDVFRQKDFKTMHRFVKSACKSREPRSNEGF